VVAASLPSALAQGDKKITIALVGGAHHPHPQASLTG